MNVVDAGVVVELLAGNLAPDRLGDEELAAPHLIDSEVTHALRVLVQRGVLSSQQADLVFDGFGQLILTRFPAMALRERMWALRHNLSGYDATYVALAESIDASALLTTDARLARASGVRCRIDVL